MMKIFDKAEVTNKLTDSMKNEDEAGVQAAFSAVIEHFEDEVKALAAENKGVNDAAVLAARGVRQLSSEETKFYNAWIKAARSERVKDALSDEKVIMPTTTFDEVLKGIETEHPLLSEIDLQHAGGLMKFITSKVTRQEATWGSLFGPVTKEAAAGFQEVSIEACKLSVFIPVSNAMLDLGPAYLDVFTRKVLAEALANGAEKAILQNLTSNTGPISMTADLTNGAAASGVITYTEKTAKKITDLDPVTVGGLLATLAKDDDGKDRNVDGVALIVNPTDHFTKIMPATTVMTAAGTYATGVLPYPMKIIKSAYVPTGKAVLGIPKNYFLGIGTPIGGVIDTDDSAKFLDDARVYRQKLYGNGQPKDNSSFILLDVSGLKPANLAVKVTEKVTE